MPFPGVLYQTQGPPRHDAGHVGAIATALVPAQGGAPETRRGARSGAPRAHRYRLRRVARVAGLGSTLLDGRGYVLSTPVFQPRHGPAAASVALSPRRRRVHAAGAFGAATAPAALLFDRRGPKNLRRGAQPGQRVDRPRRTDVQASRTATTPATGCWCQKACHNLCAAAMALSCWAAAAPDARSGCMGDSSPTITRIGPSRAALAETAYPALSSDAGCAGPPTRQPIPVRRGTNAVDDSSCMSGHPSPLSCRRQLHARRVRTRLGTEHRLLCREFAVSLGWKLSARPWSGLEQ